MEADRNRTEVHDLERGNWMGDLLSNCRVLLDGPSIRTANRRNVKLRKHLTKLEREKLKMEFQENGNMFFGGNAFAALFASSILLILLYLVHSMTEYKFSAKLLSSKKHLEKHKVDGLVEHQMRNMMFNLESDQRRDLSHQHRLFNRRIYVNMLLTERRRSATAAISNGHNRRSLTPVSNGQREEHIVVHPSTSTVSGDEPTMMDYDAIDTYWRWDIDQEKGDGLLFQSLCPEDEDQRQGWEELSQADVLYERDIQLLTEKQLNSQLQDHLPIFPAPAIDDFNWADFAEIVAEEEERTGTRYLLLNGILNEQEGSDRKNHWSFRKERQAEWEQQGEDGIDFGQGRNGKDGFGELCWPDASDQGISADLSNIPLESPPPTCSSAPISSPFPFDEQERQEQCNFESIYASPERSVVLFNNVSLADAALAASRIDIGVDDGDDDSVDKNEQQDRIYIVNGDINGSNNLFSTEAILHDLSTQQMLPSVAEYPPEQDILPFSNMETTASPFLQQFEQINFAEGENVIEQNPNQSWAEDHPYCSSRQSASVQYCQTGPAEMHSLRCSSGSSGFGGSCYQEESLTGEMTSPSSNCWSSSDPFSAFPSRYENKLTPPAEDSERAEFNHPDQFSMEQQHVKKKRGRKSKDDSLVNQHGLPYPAERLTAMTYKEYAELMHDNKLSAQQRALIKKIRRRGRNKAAAQKCREKRTQNSRWPQQGDETTEEQDYIREEEIDEQNNQWERADEKVECAEEEEYDNSWAQRESEEYSQISTPSTSTFVAPLFDPPTAFALQHSHSHPHRNYGRQHQRRPIRVQM